MCFNLDISQKLTCSLEPYFEPKREGCDFWRIAHGTFLRMHNLLSQAGAGTTFGVNGAWKRCDMNSPLYGRFFCCYFLLLPPPLLPHKLINFSPGIFFNLLRLYSSCSFNSLSLSTGADIRFFGRLILREIYC